MSDAKVAIITAAGGGIGEACTRDLANRGYTLFLMTRSEAGTRLAKELNCEGIQGSVTEPGDLQRLVDLAMEKEGRIDAVLNNTGHAPGSSSPTGRRYDPSAKAHLLDITDEDWHKSLDLYFLNVVRMARLVTPVMQKQKSGAIVNISAFGTHEPSYAYPSSSAIRSALSGFTKLYADRYAKDGIRMNNVQPGYLNNWEWSDDLVASIPAGRPGKVQEIANVAAFLLSSESSYITGQNILADGGLNRSV